MKHIVAFLPYLILLVLAGLFSACECEDLSPVTPEGTPNTFLVTQSFGGIDDIIYMGASFNGNIDTAGLKLSKTVLVEDLTIEELYISGKNIYISGPGTNCGDSTCRVKITIKGTGPNALKSISGQVLDGDSDGTQGGDYVRELIVK